MRAAALLSLCIALAGCKPKESPTVSPSPQPRALKPSPSPLWTATTGREFVDHQRQAVLDEDVPRFWESWSSAGRKKMLEEAEELLRQGKTDAATRQRIEREFRLERPLTKYAAEELAHALLRVKLEHPQNRRLYLGTKYIKERRNGAVTEVVVQYPDWRCIYQLVFEDGAFRLESEDGEGESPRTEPTPLLKTEEQPKSLIPASARKVRLKRVSDGDTIQSTDGEKIRYIGIDTPELSHGGKPEEPFAQEAAEFNRKLVEERDLFIETDVVERDDYKRTLAYVWVRDGDREVMVNAEIVRAGLAYAYTFPPNVRHAETFQACQREARENRRGFWKDYKIGGEDYYVATPRGKAYHRLSCDAAQKAKELKKFKDQNEALDAGLSPCRNCKP